ncbi:unnamed protein product [Owenia fusiformis]|uniref:Uncharacterized protein n=1 Tax=Owenia fusiformis TaxID=6347 RepID=A0A8J1TTP5_OWEFU|nr:unnamed protein product [Owenia fusiformis]
MDSCRAVEKEVDRVLSKFVGIDGHTTQSLDDLIQYVSGISQELSVDVNRPEVSTTQQLILQQCCQKIKDTVSRLASEHKDLHSSVSKVGKAIDRNFVTEFNGIAQDYVFEGVEKQEMLNKVIVEHFLRQGMLDIAEELINETNIEIDPVAKEPFLELHRILEALKHNDLDPALTWSRVHRQQLQAQNSSLEFKLHRLHFIRLISQGPEKQQEALLYSQNFAPFSSQHERDIQILMGSLLYMKRGIQSSPYAYLLDTINWIEIADVFTRDACSLLGMSVESPLSVCIRAGCSALPPLLNIKQVMQQRQCTGVWSAKDELPVEIDLGKECRYHSIFACPILRQQSTGSNPPVRLVCGHCISKDALNKLANGSKVKCPYCPVEQSPADAKEIIF